MRHRLKHTKRPVNGKHVNIKNKVSIELRPTIVDTQERQGEWEIDILIGENGECHSYNYRAQNRLSIDENDEIWLNLRLNCQSCY